jgi:hypothetical protein
MGNVIRFPASASAAPPKPLVRPAPTVTLPKRRPRTGIVEWLWYATAALYQLGQYPFAIWTVIELVRALFGHPLWHAGACFALMLGMGFFITLYRPPSERDNPRS